MKFRDRDLQIGDTIQCHDFIDMMQVVNDLGKHGYIAEAVGKYKLKIVEIMSTESELEGK